MKIAVAIATERALSSAFVVFRGIEKSIQMASELGYDGVELALKGADDIDISKVQQLLNQNKLEVSAISTGQLFAEKKLWLSSKDKNIKLKAINELSALIDIASEFKCSINIGRVRGFIEENDCFEETLKRFYDGMEKVAQYGKERNVNIVLEPVNRYETNFINNLEEGAKIINEFAIPNLKLMPDLFHMNIEDAQMEQGLINHKDLIQYIHFADSNRLAPGWGHINFESIINTLKQLSYSDWISVEILPNPSPQEAAKQAITYLRQYIKQ